MIKNYLKILTLFLGVLFTQSVNAAGYETGEATEYQITVSKIELCATGSAIPTSDAAFSCLTPVTVSTAGLDSAVDIGNDAIGAGEAAATLGNFGLASPGVTYTHLIATMKREIQITGKTLSCSTKGDGTKAANVTGETGSGVAASSSTTPVSAKLFVPAMSNNSGNRSIRSVSNVAGDDATNGGTIDASHDFFQGMLVLTTPFTLIPGQNPTVTMAFDTSTAVGALEGNDCSGGGKEMHAAPPTTTITIQGQ
ncbi:hypothetical protein OAS53_03480 [Candidatus Pelagibacter ubique]|nr:hypothetical protein [Candidatus Pelagibacter ubique]